MTISRMSPAPINTITIHNSLFMIIVRSRKRTTLSRRAGAACFQARSPLGAHHLGHGGGDTTPAWLKLHPRVLRFQT
ncbi:hypothetical protein [Mesorhizobium tamadayense]|uniref:hypothetical protein n=1 Tax=Mesorhizobium tamadayense TaxID=425306 RepID=UPI00197F961E|nr:hypothetical protein [Mesorhizobium tamadayense]